MPKALSFSLAQPSVGSQKLKAADSYLLVVADADDGIFPGHDHRGVDGVRVSIKLAEQVGMLASRYHRGHPSLLSTITKFNYIVLHVPKDKLILGNCHVIIR